MTGTAKSFVDALDAYLDAYRRSLAHAAPAPKSPAAQPTAGAPAGAARQLSDAVSKFNVYRERITHDLGALKTTIEKLSNPKYKQVPPEGFIKDIAAAEQQAEDIFTEVLRVEEKLLEARSLDPQNPALSKAIKTTEAQKKIASALGVRAKKLRSSVVPTAANKGKNKVKKKEPARTGGRGQKTKKELAADLLATYMKTKAGGASMMGFTALLVILGAWYFWPTDEGKKLVSDTNDALQGSTIKLTRLQFQQSSQGRNSTLDLAANYENVRVMLPKLQEDATVEQLLRYGAALDSAESKTNAYLQNKESIKADLVSEDGWDDAIKSIESTKTALAILKNNLDAEAKRRANIPPTPGQESASGAPDYEVPGTSGRNNIPIARTERGEPLDYATVNDVKLDFRNAPYESAGFRSAVPRMIKKMMTKPYGLAFMDPEGKIWTGYLSRSTRRPTERDYWRAIGYLYKKGVYTNGQLRRHMRRVLSKDERRRGSAWNQALRYYRTQRNRYANIFYTKNIKKISKITHIDLTSINKEGVFMRKLSNEFSDQYIQDAMRGLSDEYAKSYYTGLKSMYDERLGVSDVDYAKLYSYEEGAGAKTITNAHPESITVADAMGRGGLVENVVEQQRAIKDVALSTPTGNFHNRHANLIIELNKIATNANKMGNNKASKMIAETISGLRN